MIELADRDALSLALVLREPPADECATAFVWASAGRRVPPFVVRISSFGRIQRRAEIRLAGLPVPVRGLGEDRPIEQVAGPELGAWVLELRSTLEPVSVAGYVRTLKVFGNWLAAEELATAGALRGLRRRGSRQAH